MVGKLKVCHCPNCEINTFAQGEKNNFQLDKYQITKKVITILESSQNAYQKKIELFNFLENLDLGELKHVEKQRVNYLLQSCLYSELADKSMKEYKKITTEEFSKIE